MRLLSWARERGIYDRTVQPVVTGGSDRDWGADPVAILLARPADGGSATTVECQAVDYGLCLPDTHRTAGDCVHRAADLATSPRGGYRGWGLPGCLRLADDPL